VANYHVAARSLQIHESAQILCSCAASGALSFFAAGALDLAAVERALLVGQSLNSPLARQLACEFCETSKENECDTCDSAAVPVLTASLLAIGACTSGTTRDGTMLSTSKTAAPRWRSAATARDLAQWHTHGPYYWLRDDTRLDPRVLGYLNAENAYTDAQLKPLQGLQEKLYEEIVARIPQDDVSVPYRKRGYWYVTRLKAGSEYPIYARRRDAADAPEEVLLDVNQLAQGHDYFNVGTYVPSHDNRLLAYAEDSVGRRQYLLRVKDLASGSLLDDTIENAEPSIVWAGDDKSFLYVEKDPVTLLGFRVRRHVLGTGRRAGPNRVGTDRHHVLYRHQRIKIG